MYTHANIYVYSRPLKQCNEISIQAQSRNYFAFSPAGQSGGGGGGQLCSQPIHGCVSTKVMDVGLFLVVR